MPATRNGFNVAWFFQAITENLPQAIYAIFKLWPKSTKVPEGLDTFHHFFPADGHTWILELRLQDPKRLLLDAEA